MCQVAKSNFEPRFDPKGFLTFIAGLIEDIFFTEHYLLQVII